MKKQSNPRKKEKHSSRATDTTTVEESIRPYAIADKLRTLRLRRSMGLAQLAELEPARRDRTLSGRRRPSDRRRDGDRRELAHRRRGRRRHLGSLRAREARRARL